MTSRSGKGKGKKTVETSLGRAPGQSDKQVDLSHVRKPISTSVFGIKQVLSLLKDATAEVQDYITYECDILYECRMCRSIFRSLANFILHKREYCREKCNASREAPGSVKETVSNYVIDEEVIELSDEHSRSVTPETPAHCAAKPAKALSPVIEKLLKKHGVADLERETLNEDLAKQSEYRPEDDHPDQKQDNVVLQKIEANPSAVFQTMVADPGGGGLEDESLTKTEVMELHGMLDDNTVVLSATGKICNLETARYFAKANIPKQEYICTACNSRFSTKKTLKSHLQRKHNKSCLMYLCPDCKESYSTAWGVFRHLSKVHKKTMSQVKRMRNQIHSNAVLKELEPVKKQDKKASDESEETEEDQWIRNIEKDKDFQMCGGCGRRFERKAALHSHSQTCSKRITVCNAIKESKAKMSASKPKTPSKSDKVADATAGLKGAAKRKAGPLQNRLNPDKFGLKKSNVKREDVKSNGGVAAVEFKASVFKKEAEEQAVPGTEECYIVSDDEGEEINNSDEHKEAELNAPPSPNIDDYYAPDESNCQRDPLRNSDEEDPSPTIEIYNISDDSADGADWRNDPEQSVEMFKDEMPTLIPAFPNGEKKFEPKQLEVSCLKRRRTDSSDNEQVDESVPEAMPELVNQVDALEAVQDEEEDEEFVLRAEPYMRQEELRCIPCQISYGSLNQLLWHMSLHFSWYRFQCSRCPFMSFNKYDCANHAVTSHGTPSSLIESTVLPIPKWKTMCMSHQFTKTKSDTLQDTTHKVPVGMEAVSKSSVADNKELDSLLTDYFNSQPEPRTSSEDDSPNNTQAEEGAEEPMEDIELVEDTEPVEDADPMQETRDLSPLSCIRISEAVTVIDDDEEEDLRFREFSYAENLPSPEDPPKAIRPRAASLSLRPKRNRVKSVKTLQEDFIYDLGPARANHNSKKSRRS